MNTVRQDDFQARLKAFHANHFPGQPIPEGATPSQQPCQEDTPDHDYTGTMDTDNLGYYGDGVKRTLTDDQVKIFRHSEIQRLLTERRLAKEREEKEKIRKERKETSLHSQGPGSRRFYDEPAETHNPVNTLDYDDLPPTRETSKPTSDKQQFLWPVLGRTS